ncbi:MAG: hypothetical protein ACYC5A_09360 [Thermoleophilia bacterium]
MAEKNFFLEYAAHTTTARPNIRYHAGGRGCQRRRRSDSQQLPQADQVHHVLLVVFQQPPQGLFIVVMLPAGPALLDLGGVNAFGRWQGCLQGLGAQFRPDMLDQPGFFMKETDDGYVTVAPAGLDVQIDGNSLLPS